MEVAEGWDAQVAAIPVGRPEAVAGEEGENFWMREIMEAVDYFLLLRSLLCRRRCR